jgi:hypothetical protein
MKVIVLLLLAAIAASLFSGLFFLTRKNRDSTQLLRSLKIRVALSIVLIVFLVASYQLGFIAP